MKRFIVLLSAMALLLFSGSIVLAAPEKPDRGKAATAGQEAATAADADHGKPDGVGAQEKGGKANKAHAHVSGVVQTVGDSSFTLLNPKLGTVTVTVDGNTRWTNGKKKAESLSDVKIGSRVLAFGSWTTQDEQLSAVRVHVIPGRPGYTHAVGEVTGYDSGKSIQVTNRYGVDLTFDIVDGTKISPEGASIVAKNGSTAGSWVTVVANRIEAGDTSITPTARAIVVHDKAPDQDKDGAKDQDQNKGKDKDKDNNETNS